MNYFKLRSSSDSSSDSPLLAGERRRLERRPRLAPIISRNSTSPHEFGSTSPSSSPTFSKYNHVSQIFHLSNLADSYPIQCSHNDYNDHNLRADPTPTASSTILSEGSKSLPFITRKFTPISPSISSGLPWRSSCNFPRWRGWPRGNAGRARSSRWPGVAYAQTRPGHRELESGRSC